MHATPTTTHYITQPNVNQNLAFNPESDLEAKIKTEMKEHTQLGD